MLPYPPANFPLPPPHASYPVHSFSPVPLPASLPPPQTPIPGPSSAVQQAAAVLKPIASSSSNRNHSTGVPGTRSSRVAPAYTAPALINGGAYRPGTGSPALPSSSRAAAAQGDSVRRSQPSSRRQPQVQSTPVSYSPETGYASIDALVDALNGYIAAQTVEPKGKGKGKETKSTAISVTQLMLASEFASCPSVT